MRIYTKQHCGFTLIELLVAMSIFSIVSLLTWQGFSTLIHHYQQLSNELKELQQWELGLAQLKKDVLQIPHISTDDSTHFSRFEGNAHSMTFSTLGKEGRLAHVTYNFSDEQLERQVQYAPWDKPPTHTSILRHIKHGHFNYIVNQQRFSQQKGLPEGIQCQFSSTEEGEVSRIIVLKENFHE